MTGCRSAAQVVDHDLDRTDLLLDRRHAIFDRVGVDGVEQVARRGAALALDLADETSQALLIGAAAEDGVVALGREAPSGVTADSRARRRVRSKLVSSRNLLVEG